MSYFCGTLVRPGERFTAAKRKAHPRQDTTSERRRSPRVALRTHPHHPPARALAAETLELERALSDLVNQAYALTPAEIALMWQTAPPRMPMPRPAA
jgi:hypothetical protein